VGLLRRCYGGQGGPGITGGKESRGQSVSPAAALGSILARAGLGVKGGATAALAGAEVHRSGGSAAEQGHRAAEQGGCGAEASVAAAKIRVRVHRGLGCSL
jgi:hypothetical protein